MGDLLIHATGNGGDANLVSPLGSVVTNDFELTEGLFNMVFLAMFGGNPGNVTTETFEEGEQRYDWWGNSLFFNNVSELQFNSYTENILNNVSLTSQSREIIKGFVQKDLDFLSNLAETTVSVYLLDNDRIEIEVKLQELSNKQNSEFQFIWDATKSELIEKRII